MNFDDLGYEPERVDPQGVRLVATWTRWDGFGGEEVCGPEVYGVAAKPVAHLLTGGSIRATVRQRVYGTTVVDASAELFGPGRAEDAPMQLRCKDEFGVYFEVRCEKRHFDELRRFEGEMLAAAMRVLQTAVARLQVLP